ncbi:probable SEC14-like protein 2 at C-terminar half [Coccomyxa sp. Obi]|nr:probable SEC14-like protein 2 at C-terminar half [Coccomyxa sp. Obi]
MPCNDFVGNVISDAPLGISVLCVKHNRMSSGDQGARVVVDLASFQPLEDGPSSQSIHSVRLQQMCPAKRRRRFLRRGNARPPGSPATNHIRKDAILVIGVDRLIIGVVEEEVKPSTDKSAERMAAKAAREEEKAASRALKQEERAAARAHRDAARAAARADREAGRSAPRTGGPLGVLRMRRAASGPDIGALVDREMDGSGEASSPDREPTLGSASPSLSASPDPRPPPPPATALHHRRSRSQALPDLPVSDGEIETGTFRHTANGASPVGSSPLRSSPLRIGQRTPDTNGHATRSPFSQDDLALPRTPQQHNPAEWPAVARISGMDIEQHTFSADVAYSQVVRIEREAEEVTVFYRPNSLSVEELSRNPVANSLAVTFLLNTETAAMELVTEVERAVERYCQGMGHLGRQLPLPGPPQLLLVTHRRPAEAAGAAAEAVVHCQPSWGTTIPAPASWDAAVPLASPEDASAGGDEDVIVVYVTSPLGGGSAQISLPVVRHFLQGEEAHLFLGVAIRPAARSVERRASLLVRRSILPGSAEDAADAALGSTGDWQPADSILEDIEPSPASTTSTTESAGDSFTSRGNGDGSGRDLERRGKIRKSKQVRLHCIASCRERGLHKASAWAHTNGHSRPPNGGPPGESSTLLTVAGFSATAVPLLLQGYWLLLLQWALVALIVAACWYPDAALCICTFSAACMQSLIKGEPLPELPQLRASASASVQAMQETHLQNAVPGSLSSKWRLTLLRAELVDDFWVAAGPSLDADVGVAERAAPAEEPESKLDALTAAHSGTSRDTAQRYLMAANDDLPAAHRLLQASREWREVKLQGKGMLQQPQPHFEAFKALFSHGVLGFSFSGRPIWVMKVGEIKKGLKALKATGVTPDDYQRHIMFVQDYMYEVLDPNPVPEGRSIWIIDMKGVGLTDLGSEAMDYVKVFAGIVAAHYPERLYRNFVVNAPGFFSLVWRIAEPMLSPSTRKKIRLLHNKQDALAAFREEMAEDIIPAVYGGPNGQHLYESKPELELRQLVQRLNGQG